MFLDKVCIHQTDTKLQKEGIAHLGMFLLFSGQLVVLQDDDYLERLWTVYELATFLSLQPKRPSRDSPCQPAHGSFCD